MTSKQSWTVICSLSSREFFSSEYGKVDVKDSVPSGVRTLKQLVQHTKDNADVEMPPTYEATDRWPACLAKDRGEDDQYLFQVYNNRSVSLSGAHLKLTEARFCNSAQARGSIDDTLTQHSLSAIVFPSPQSIPWAKAGYPIITVPFDFLPQCVFAFRSLCCLIVCPCTKGNAQRARLEQEDRPAE